MNGKLTGAPPARRRRGAGDDGGGARRVAPPRRQSRPVAGDADDDAALAWGLAIAVLHAVPRLCDSAIRPVVP